MRRILLVAAAVIVGLTAPSATPAVADSSQCSIAASGASSCAARANFVSLGEHLYVEDRIADGLSAVARYWLEGGTGPFLVWNSNGAGSRVDRDLELPEGSWIFYQVCVGVALLGDVWTSTCSAGVTDYA